MRGSCLDGNIFPLELVFLHSFMSHYNKVSDCFIFEEGEGSPWLAELSFINPSPLASS